MRLSFTFFIVLAQLIFQSHFAWSVETGRRFETVSFHDVIDFKGDLDDDAVTTDTLIGFFEWLKGNDWTAISLDDIERANQGGKPLPEKAVLITFDDGYESLYTRVYPLLRAYKFPVVCALVGAWMEVPMDGKVVYGDMLTPRSKFLDWNHAREMQRSGLVEFASHGYDIHKVVPANPQGNELAAAYARIYDKEKGYEDGSSFRKRLTEDLVRSREMLKRELGKFPRALVWPYGRYTGEGIQAAKECGFSMAFTLDREPGDVRHPYSIGRYLPSHDPKLSVIVDGLTHANPFNNALRIVAVDPAQLWAGGMEGMNDRLGIAIERLRTLGATTVVIDGGALDSTGRLESVWFPNSKIPVRADILSRIAWQMHSRGGVDVVIRLPSDAAFEALGKEATVIELFHELGVHVPFTGLFVEKSPHQLSCKTGRLERAATPWEIRHNRSAMDVSTLRARDRLALETFRAAEQERPNLQLFLLSEEFDDGEPSSLADVTLVKADAQNIEKSKIISRMKDSGWLSPIFAYQCGLWFQGDQVFSARDISHATRLFQRSHGTVIGWSMDDISGDRPNAKELARSVSASSFPVKF